MFHNEEILTLQAAVKDAVQRDGDLLTALREVARGFRSAVHVVQPRSATTVSLVASDGGNHSFPLDPFFVQVVRVVDSYGLPLCFDVVTPSTDIKVLSKRQFENDGSTPRTALGRLMKDLKCSHLADLSTAIPTQQSTTTTPEDVSTGWVVTYRDLCEWATLYERICYQNFPTDTVLVRDGLLRAKYFSGTLFTKLGELIDKRIAELKRNRRRVFLVGVAKHSKILDRYGLAFAIENTFPDGNACYLEVPRDLEKTVYRWSEYARGRLDPGEGEEPRFVNGKMFLTRFGKRNTDPIWPVDIFESQAASAQEILGFLVQDAINGFPIPFYPRSLQLAHEWAEIAGFDADIIGDAMRIAVSETDTKVRDAIENRSLGDADISARRYR
jgi:hypothetical protein